MFLVNSIKSTLGFPKLDDSTKVENISNATIDKSKQYYAKYRMDTTVPLLKLVHKDRKGKALINIYTCNPNDADDPSKYPNLSCDGDKNGGKKYGDVVKTTDVLNFDKLLIIDKSSRDYSKEVDSGIQVTG